MNMSIKSKIAFTGWIFAAIVSLHSFSAFSQNADCKCCTPEHDQFNFWVGEWEVHDTSGNKVGENSIQKAERNCVLTETWNGSSGGTGRSFNYYDPADSTWNQLWISSSGGILKLKGQFEGDKMILESDYTTDPKGRLIKNRITWYEMEEDGKVAQIWEMVDENEEIVAVSFHGIYTRKE